MAADQTFDGEWRPGGPGVTTMPIALLGRGSITVGTDGLTVLGTRERSSKLLIAAVIVAMCAALFAVGMLADPEVLGHHNGKVARAMSALSAHSEASARLRGATTRG